jgi:hypothetical protein
MEKSSDDKHRTPDSVPVLSDSLMARRRLFTLANVTTDELWQNVGKELARIRTRKGYETTYGFYMANRDLAPSYNTLNDIESGRPGYTETLTAYCRALGVLLPDVLRHALGDAPDDLDSDALALARAYQDSKHAELKRAVEQLFRVTAALPATTPAPSPAEPPATSAVAADKKPPARPRKKR